MLVWKTTHQKRGLILRFDLELESFTQLIAVKKTPQSASRRTIRSRTRTQRLYRTAMKHGKKTKPSNLFPLLFRNINTIYSVYQDRLGTNTGTPHQTEINIFCRMTMIEVPAPDLDKKGAPKKGKPQTKQVRKRSFQAIYALKRSFYQDRLGTNIGKTLKHRLPVSEHADPADDGPHELRWRDGGTSERFQREVR